VGHDFYLAGRPVGSFPDEPTTPGRYAYDPYRGEGRAELARALRQGKSVVCSLTSGWKTVRLPVTAEEFVGTRWYVRVGEVWARPRAVVLLLARLAIGMAVLARGTR
jgi:hypothetical protein